MLKHPVPVSTDKWHKAAGWVATSKKKKSYIQIKKMSWLKYINWRVRDKYCIQCGYGWGYQHGMPMMRSPVWYVSSLKDRCLHNNQICTGEQLCTSHSFPVLWVYHKDVILFLYIMMLRYQVLSMGSKKYLTSTYHTYSVIDSICKERGIDRMCFLLLLFFSPVLKHTTLRSEKIALSTSLGTTAVGI